MGGESILTSLFLGCGTGRSGSLSLATLLNGCKGVTVTHEAKPRLEWEITDQSWKRFEDRLNNLREKDGLAGDVAFYYLPYLEKLEDWQGLKVIILKRNRDETVESFMRESGDFNNWQPGGRKGFWFPYFPTIHHARNKRDALGKYWDLYYKRAAKLRSSRPGRVRVLSIDNLNSWQGQHLIFQFLEIPSSHRKYQVPCKVPNRSRNNPLK